MKTFPYVQVSTIGARGGADVDPKSARGEDTVEAFFVVHRGDGRDIRMLVSASVSRLTVRRDGYDGEVVFDRAFVGVAEEVPA